MMNKILIALLILICSFNSYSQGIWNNERIRDSLLSYHQRILDAGAGSLLSNVTNKLQVEAEDSTGNAAGSYMTPYRFEADTTAFRTHSDNLYQAAGTGADSTVYATLFRAKQIASDTTTASKILRDSIDQVVPVNPIMRLKLSGSVTITGDVQTTPGADKNVIFVGSSSMAQGFGIRSGGDYSFNIDRLNSSSWTNALSISRSNGSIGFGTSDLDGTPPIGRIVPQASASDGSSNIFVGRNAAGENKTTVSDRGSFYYSGGQYYKTIRSENGYFATNYDHIISVDATPGDADQYLPAGITGLTYTFFKEDASVEPVTIYPDGSETINGAASLALPDQYDTATITYNGVMWMVTSLILHP